MHIQNLKKAYACLQSAWQLSRAIQPSDGIDLIDRLPRDIDGVLGNIHPDSIRTDLARSFAEMVWEPRMGGKFAFSLAYVTSLAQYYSTKRQVDSRTSRAYEQSFS